MKATDEQKPLRLHAIVSGRVQGVGYRYFALREARQLGLRGYVRNLAHEAEVEVVAEGEREALEQFARLLAEGPQWARVENVQTSYAPPTGEFTEFTVRG